jgi:hypothetical protein
MGQPSESMADTPTNREKAQRAYSGLEDLLRSGLNRGFSGTITIELDIKQGTILDVEALQRRRL